MVRFVTHLLIESMRIHCSSVKCCEIFGWETASFFCLNVPIGGRCRFPMLLLHTWWDGTACCLTACCVLLENTRASCLNTLNELLSVSKMGKL